jgi:hypothetical protein
MIRLATIPQRAIDRELSFAGNIQAVEEPSDGGWQPFFVHRLNAMGVRSLQCMVGRSSIRWLYSGLPCSLADFHLSRLSDQLGWPIWSRRCKSSFTAGVGADLQATSR